MLVEVVLIVTQVGIITFSLSTLFEYLSWTKLKFFHRHIRYKLWRILQLSPMSASYNHSMLMVLQCWLPFCHFTSSLHQKKTKKVWKATIPSDRFFLRESSTPACFLVMVIFLTYIFSDRATNRLQAPGSWAVGRLQLDNPPEKRAFFWYLICRDILDMILRGLMMVNVISCT